VEIITINYDSIKNSLRIDESTTGTIRSFVGTTPQFDADQNPLNSFSDTGSKFLVLEPTKIDKEYFGGLLTENAKKLVFNKDESIEVSDEIYWGSGTFKAMEVQTKITRTVVFANKDPNT
jgi:hypothetical protein